jgi:glycosyltransferase involved in cell wall biosynthesis
VDPVGTHASAGTPTRSTPDASNTLRILAFCDHFRSSTGGGAERVALETYTRLVAQGHAVRVMTTAAPDAAWVKRAEGIEIQPVRACDLSRVTRMQLSVPLPNSALLRRTCEEFRPDVLHAHSLQFASTLLAAQLTRKSSLPLVVTAHIAGFEHLATLSRKLASLHERFVGRHVLKQATAVIAVSSAVGAHLARTGSVGPKVHVVPNGVDHGRFAPVDRARAPARADDTLTVAVVGRLISNKGPVEALEAFARCPAAATARLVFIGDGPLRAALTRRSADLGVTERVSLLGHVDDVARYLGDCDVLLRPTLTEGMPLAVLEAMACGVCVIATDIPGNRELVTPGAGMLVPPGSVDDLAAALQVALSDPVQRSAFAERAIDTVDQYSWDNCAQRTLAVLRHAVANKTSSIEGEP